MVVLDTGSRDGTPELLRQLGAEVTEEVISPWRFDVARNRSLELVPQARINLKTRIFHKGRFWSNFSLLIHTSFY